MNSDGASISFQGVTKTYGNRDVVSEFSLDVPSGSFFTILGPSGSGKSTALMMLAGFVKPERGQIFVSGQNVTEAPPQRRGLGLVFQRYAVFPHLSVFENVAFPLRVRGYDRQKIRRFVDEALAMVQLQGFENRMPPGLSGGEQQRVALARAITYRPPVLLLDEPLGALDKKLRVQMQYELKRIQRELGITFIAVTHDQEEAMTMSDAVAVIHQGRLAQVDTPNNVYERPSSRFVADFLGESNLIDVTIEALDAGGTAAVRSRQGEGFRGILAGDASVGDTATMVVRPEKIWLDSFPGDGNATSGVVQDIGYAGDSIRYVVTLPSGRAIVAKFLNRERLGIEPGSQVQLGWKFEDTRILPAVGSGISREGKS